MAKNSKQDKTQAEQEKERQRKRDPETFERFGRPLNLQQHPLTAPHEQSWLSAAGRAADMAWQDTKHRWRSLGDDSSLVSPGEFEEIVGDRDIPYDRGMTKETATFLANEHDREQYSQQYESRPVAEFAGALLPSLPEPVNLATMPIGGTRFAAAAGSKTVKGFAKNMAVGGTKVSAATVPAEAALEQETYGETRPGMLGFTAAVPFAAPTILSTPALALKGIKKASTTRTVAESPGARATDDIEEMSNTIEDDAGRTEAPPTPQESSPPPAPTSRLQEQFQGFEGGADGWVRSMSRGSTLARDFVSKAGLDPDSPALKAFFRSEGYRNAWTGEPKPGKAIPSMTEYARAQSKSELSNDSVEDLVEQGILAQTEDGSTRVRAPFKPVMDALADSDADQAPLRQFMDNGPERTAAKFAEDALDRANRAFTEDMDATTRMDELRSAMEDMEDAGSRPMPIKGEYSKENLLNALDAARMEAPVREAEPTQAKPDFEAAAPRAPKETTGTDELGDGAETSTEAGPRRGMSDPEEESVRDYAQQRGADVKETDQMVDNVLERMSRCSQ